MHAQAYSFQGHLLQSGISDNKRKVSPYLSRHRTAQDVRRTDKARRSAAADGAVGRIRHRSRYEHNCCPALSGKERGAAAGAGGAGKPSVVKTHPSIDRMFTTARFTMAYGDGQDISRHLGDAPRSVCCYVVWVFESNFGEISNHG